MGSGLTIAVVGDNDVNPDDITTFQSSIGLPHNAPTTNYVSSYPAGVGYDQTTGLGSVNISVVFKPTSAGAVALLKGRCPTTACVRNSPGICPIPIV